MKRRALVLAALCALAVCAPERTPPRACGPFFPYVVFTHARRPDFPLVTFAAGQLGVLSPALARSYLCVAYRVLEGRPLGEPARGEAVEVWRHRLQLDAPTADADRPAVREWRAMRARVVTKRTPPIERYRPTPGQGGYASILNCTDDAFRTAARTLAERIATWGPEDARVVAWIAAQDSIFAGCPAGVANGALIEAEVDSGTTRADRAYQTAASAFYAADYPRAESLFLAVARDSRSPWRVMAPYLAARAIVRNATTSAPPGESDARLLAHADSVLSRLVADPAYAAMRRPCEDLRAFVRARLAPGARLAELGRALAGGDADTAFGRDLDDLTILLDKAVDRYGSGREEPQALQALRDSADTSELVDWVLTFQQCQTAAPTRATFAPDWIAHRSGDDPYAHALARWNRGHAVAWLIVALAAARTDAPEVPGLLDAAAAVPVESPAWPTLACLRATWLAARGRPDAARSIADRALALPAMPASSTNRFRALRCEVAASFADFMRFVSRAPVAFTDDSDPDALRPDPPSGDLRIAAAKRAQGIDYLDDDGAAAFDRDLPLRRWIAAATDTAVPARLRGQLALAGWTRAVACGHDSLALGFVPALGAARPDLVPALREWRLARPGPARMFAAAVMVLRNPGARPDVRAGIGRANPDTVLDGYRDNWWRARGAAGMAAEFVRHFSAFDSIAGAPAFVTAAETATAHRERSALDALPSGPEWLGSIVLAWAAVHPLDPRVPEALHRVVGGIRVGVCGPDAATTARRAFRLLHARYPASEWTRRTPTWSV